MIVVPKNGIDYQKRGACEKGGGTEDTSTRRDTISELGVTCSSPLKKGRRLVMKTVTEQLRINSNLGLRKTELPSRKNQSSTVVDNDMMVFNMMNKPHLNNYVSGGSPTVPKRSI